MSDQPAYSLANIGPLVSGEWPGRGRGVLPAGGVPFHFPAGRGSITCPAPIQKYADVGASVRRVRSGGEQTDPAGDFSPG